MEKRKFSKENLNFSSRWKYWNIITACKRYYGNWKKDASYRLQKKFKEALKIMNQKKLGMLLLQK